MKNANQLVDEDRLKEKGYDREIMDGITRKVVLASILETGLPLDPLTYERKLTPKESEDINTLISHIYSNNSITMCDIILFFESDNYIEVEKAKKLLNEYNMSILRQEMAAKYGIKGEKVLGRFED